MHTNIPVVLNLILRKRTADNTNSHSPFPPPPPSFPLISFYNFFFQFWLFCETLPLEPYCAFGIILFGACPAEFSPPGNEQLVSCCLGRVSDPCSITAFSSPVSILLVSLKHGKLWSGVGKRSSWSLLNPRYSRRVYIEQGLLAQCPQRAEV